MHKFTILAAATAFSLHALAIPAPKAADVGLLPTGTENVPQPPLGPVAPPAPSDSRTPSTGDEPLGPENAPPGPGDAPQSSGDAPPNTGDEPLSPGDAPPSPGDESPSSGDAPPSPGDAPPSSGDVPPNTGDEPPSPGDAPPSPGDAPPSPGDAPLSPGDEPPSPGDAPPNTGDEPLSPGDAPPNTGNPGPNPGNQPSTSNPGQVGAPSLYCPEPMDCRGIRPEDVFDDTIPDLYAYLTRPEFTPTCASLGRASPRCWVDVATSGTCQLSISWEGDVRDFSNFTVSRSTLMASVGPLPAEADVTESCVGFLAPVENNRMLKLSIAIKAFGLDLFSRVANYNDPVQEPTGEPVPEPTVS